MLLFVAPVFLFVGIKSWWTDIALAVPESGHVCCARRWTIMFGLIPFPLCLEPFFVPGSCLRFQVP